ncbi:unnamed protein product [Rotaria sordida]|uniref:DUF4345 domain-containing protein n=1 Tax=Rotaria sordida TaxID=392033 RepID=A0A818V3R5_9BILA|nr:unnamed protein product [Rotaria sordida]CAF1062029.1 unnamed protein product [Rotaria sordida]CAF1122763.1 unnamed protein product [Rotaria sordida]CAF1341448.1 unnamed protein product [Rotaria sordida]CAF3709483.1 unnamed protein product [Rotaria sordida]
MVTIFQRVSLKAAVGLSALVPISNGLLGIIKGPAMLEKAIRCTIPLDSHFRYLSGLPLAMGILLLRSLPNIEHDGSDLRRVTLLIFIGGLGRLWGLITSGYDTNTVIVTLSELFVLPLACIYQNHIQKKVLCSHKKS